ncbi:uncharacterized protein JN550_005231 [Neoarthrinium moseri]|uniref:uncharacterized protein n=1 Tax=Neoarthrinium moseri TaxID=1658444 RepID=UPI001FDCAA66|nr:uncharacterized protein JN550_005231 [Neoarthrinium moseri]KAI1870303.1 hypothetical protein JN550_005231 [Neoarthrinium moseri]
MIWAFAISILIAAGFLLYQWALPRPIPGVPYDYDAARNLRGNLPEMLAYAKANGRLRPWFTSHTLKHKAPLVQFWMIPFTKPMLVLADYQEAQDILLRRTKEFDRGQRGADVFHGVVPNHHIAMTSADPRFKRNKELVRDLMAPGFLNEVSAPEIYSKTMALVDLWGLKAQLAENRPFDARRDIIDAAMDIINAAAFSFDGAMITAVADHLGTQFRSVLPRLDHKIRMLTDSELRRNFSRKDAMISREINKSLGRLQSGDGTMTSALDHLLQREMNAASKAGRQPYFHSPQISDELFGYIVAGHETSATSLSSDHQDVQAKLRSALRDVYHEALGELRQPTVDEITKKNVPYLDAVIEESLRFNAPLPVFGRETTVDTVILGHKIPKGTQVFLPVDGPSFKLPGFPIADTMRSETSVEKHWGGQWDAADMHLFNPERWLKRPEDGPVIFDAQAGPILSFGLGPRGCFGKRLAYLEMKIVLALVVWNFEFARLSAPFNSPEAYDAITTMPKYCYVELKKLH